MEFIQNYWKLILILILFIVVIIIIYYISINEEFSEHVGECNKNSCGLNCECDEKCTNQQTGDKFSPCSCKGPIRMIF